MYKVVTSVFTLPKERRKNVGRDRREREGGKEVFIFYNPM